MRIGRIVLAFAAAVLVAAAAPGGASAQPSTADADKICQMFDEHGVTSESMGALAMIYGHYAKDERKELMKTAMDRCPEHLDALAEFVR